MRYRVSIYFESSFMPYTRRRIDNYIYNYQHPTIVELAKELRTKYAQFIRLDNVLNEVPHLSTKKGFGNQVRTAHTIRNLRALKAACEHFMKEIENAKTQETNPAPPSHSLR